MSSGRSRKPKKKKEEAAAAVEPTTTTADQVVWKRHVSGFFEYQQHKGRDEFVGCRLLKALPFDTTNVRPMEVTFHDDAWCQQGALVELIRQQPVNHLVGWNGDTVVMDITHA